MSTGHKACILVQPEEFAPQDHIEIVKSYIGKETMGKANYKVDYKGQSAGLHGKSGFNLDNGILIVDVGNWQLGGLEPVAMVVKLNGYKDRQNAKGTGQLRYGGGNGKLYQNITWHVIDIIDLPSEHHEAKQPKKKKKSKKKKKTSH